MPQSLSRVCVHITFSTKNRLPMIDDAVKADLWRYIGGLCKERECYPIRTGGYNDHVHICCTLSKKITQVKLLEDIKKLSSKWIKTKGRQYEHFQWQEGYGIFSINPSELENVIAYIDRQDEHHKKQAYKEELVKWLKKYNVEYDENYLWNRRVALTCLKTEANCNIVRRTMLSRTAPSGLITN